MARKTLDNKMAEPMDDFESMYESNAPLIYRFMFWRTKDEALSQDLTSHVFEKAWRSRASFTGGSAKAWLYRIARNDLIDYWRRYKEVPVEDIDALAPPVDDLAANLDKDMLATKLRADVGKLPEDMRSVVELRFMEGLSSKQVAAKLDLTEANVRVIQYRALRKLRSYLN